MIMILVSTSLNMLAFIALNVLTFASVYTPNDASILHPYKCWYIHAGHSYLPRHVMRFFILNNEG